MNNSFTIKLPVTEPRTIHLYDNHTLTIEQEDYIIEQGMENHYMKDGEEKTKDE